MLYDIFIDPFVQMYDMPEFFLQVLWEGFVAGILYALIALGFVLIFKASGVFNFAQGIMVVFAGLTLVGLHENGVPAFLALILTIGVMGILAYGVERVVMRPLVNQPDIILLTAQAYQEVLLFINKGLRRFERVNSLREWHGQAALPLAEAFLRDLEVPGMPPCAGVALGLDRLVALALGREGIRDVIAFPKTTAARALFEGAPSPMGDAQLEELGLRIDTE